MYNVLFLCTGNSARSIFGEALINHPPLGQGKFRGYSAGSQPKGQVNPLTVETLEHFHLPTDGLRSKSWNEFSALDAPKMDFVFTVCDDAAAEVCPVWPGQPMTAHWGIPDPAAAGGDEEHRRRAFRDAIGDMRRRIELFVSLPLEKLSRLALQEHIENIGRRERTTAR